jgi:hypothetical protein
MRGAGGVCKCIQCSFLHSARVWGLTTMVLKPLVLENNRVSLCSPASAHMSVVAFPSSSSRLKKREEVKKERNIRGRTSVIPQSDRVEPKPLYVCPRCSNHTYSNNMIQM